MNPVTALATFHVGQFLDDIVGVATTRGDMSATFPTKHKECHKWWSMNFHLVWEGAKLLQMKMQMMSVHLDKKWF
jgi:hypothetical protein